MAFTTHMFLRFKHFSMFLGFEAEVVTLGKQTVLFRTLRLILISAKPYYQNACIDRGIIFGFRRNLANDLILLNLGIIQPRHHFLIFSVLFNLNIIQPRYY